MKYKIGNMKVTQKQNAFPKWDFLNRTRVESMREVVSLSYFIFFRMPGS